MTRTRTKELPTPTHLAKGYAYGSRQLNVLAKSLILGSRKLEACLASFGLDI